MCETQGGYPYESRLPQPCSSPKSCARGHGTPRHGNPRSQKSFGQRDCKARPFASQSLPFDNSRTNSWMVGSCILGHARANSSLRRSKPTVYESLIGGNSNVSEASRSASFCSYSIRSRSNLASAFAIAVSAALTAAPTRSQSLGPVLAGTSVDEPEPADEQALIPNPRTKTKEAITFTRSSPFRNTLPLRVRCSA